MYFNDLMVKAGSRSTFRSERSNGMLSPRTKASDHESHAADGPRPLSSSTVIGISSTCSSSSTSSSFSLAGSTGSAEAVPPPSAPPSSSSSSSGTILLVLATFRFSGGAGIPIAGIGSTPSISSTRFCSASSMRWRVDGVSRAKDLSALITTRSATLRAACPPKRPPLRRRCQ